MPPYLRQLGAGYPMQTHQPTTTMACRECPPTPPEPSPGWPTTGGCDDTCGSDCGHRGQPPARTDEPVNGYVDRSRFEVTGDGVSIANAAAILKLASAYEHGALDGIQDIGPSLVGWNYESRDELDPLLQTLLQLQSEEAGNIHNVSALLEANPTDHWYENPVIENDVMFSDFFSNTNQLTTFEGRKAGFKNPAEQDAYQTRVLNPLRRETADLQKLFAANPARYLAVAAFDGDVSLTGVATLSTVDLLQAAAMDPNGQSDVLNEADFKVIDTLDTSYRAFLDRIDLVGPQSLADDNFLFYDVSQQRTETLMEQAHLYYDRPTINRSLSSLQKQATVELLANIGVLDTDGIRKSGPGGTETWHQGKPNAIARYLMSAYPTAPLAKDLKAKLIEVWDLTEKNGLVSAEESQFNKPGTNDAKMYGHEAEAIARLLTYLNERNP